MAGARSGQLLSYRGRVLIHDNREELQWLFPGTRVVRVSDGDIGQPVMPLAWHPDLQAAGITFPLRREDFVGQT